MKKITMTLLGLVFAFIANAQDLKVETSAKPLKPEIPKGVIFDQSDLTTTGFSSIFANLEEPDGEPVYATDDFSLPTPTNITSITAYGFANGYIDAENFLDSITGVNLYIYSNSTLNTPDGDPLQSGSGLLELEDLDPNGTSVEITNPGEGQYNFTINIVDALGTDFELPAGDYWLVVAPNMDVSVANGDFNWNWYDTAEPNAGVNEAHLLAPKFDVNDWLSYSAAGLSIGSTAFTIEGDRVGSFAEVQVVHNAPDPAASVVDVYVNGDLAIDDFEFRTATEFLFLPAGVDLDIDVAPGTSSDVSESLFTTTVNLIENENYIVAATGVLDPTQFDDSVNAIDFSLEVYEGARQSASTAGNTDILVKHGSPDAPTVDVVNQDGGDILVDDISYPEFQGYLELPTDDYLIAVTTSDNSTQVAEYKVSLAELGLDDQAVTVFASGFLDSAANQDGPEFGLWVSLASGGPLVELSGPTARAQVVHNAPDPAAEVVDVYLNGDLLLDDFEFRTATPFVDVPANQEITLSVAPGTSTDVSDALYNVDVTLVADETYIVVADGVLDPSGFDDSVNTIAFALQVFEGAREAAATAGNTDVLVHHGSPDAPAVDVVNQADESILVDDISFPEFQGYLELATDDYLIDVTTADGSTKVAGYQAYLASLGLADAAVTVFASGFLDPSNNQDGPAFGLWVSLASGGALIELKDENAFPAPYCGPLEYNSNVEPISFVEFSNNSNASSPAIDASPAHEDFTSVIIDVTAGDSYEIKLEGNTGGNFTNRFAVFIDWNQDGLFDGINEVYEIVQPLANSTGADGQQVTQVLEVPADALDGETRMRVKKIFGTTSLLDPCIGGGIGFGQAEDYTISVGTLSNNDFASTDFTYYPNPVNDILSITTTSTVDSIKVYNMLGQLVKETAPKAANPQINLSEFNTGVYLVSLEVEGSVQTFRVMKE